MVSLLANKPAIDRLATIKYDIRVSVRLNHLFHIERAPQLVKLNVESCGEKGDGILWRTFALPKRS